MSAPRRATPAPAPSSPAARRASASPSRGGWSPRAAPGWCSPGATSTRAGRWRASCRRAAPRSASARPTSPTSTTAGRSSTPPTVDLDGANALVNAAAACDRGGLLDTTPEVWARLMDMNARGPFFVMQGFARAAIARGEPASVVNILSMAIHCGQSFLAPYTASKAALAALTRNLAQAHRRDRIRFNAIAPRLDGHARRGRDAAALARRRRRLAGEGRGGAAVRPAGEARRRWPGSPPTCWRRRPG